MIYITRLFPIQISVTQIIYCIHTHTHTITTHTHTQDSRGFVHIHGATKQSQPPPTPHRTSTWSQGMRLNIWFNETPNTIPKDEARAKLVYTQLASQRCRVSVHSKLNEQVLGTRQSLVHQNRLYSARVLVCVCVCGVAYIINPQFPLSLESRFVPPPFMCVETGL